MATSPAPDAAAPPGMCPGIVVLGGGGGSGGEDGDGAGGNGDGSGSGGGNGEGAGGDGKGAPDPDKYPDCGSASHPVDVVTGRAYTHPIVDLALPGPLPLVFQRVYSSKARLRDAGLGFGWAHSLGWQIEVLSRRARILNDQGLAVEFPIVPSVGEVLGPWGWNLRRDGDGFMVDADDGLQRFFAPADTAGRRYRLIRVEDANRNRISLTYEGQSLREVTDSAGRVIRFRSTLDGRIASVETLSAPAQGQWVRFAAYTYDEHGNLTSATDADGHVARYAYDDVHRLTTDTDRVGLAFHFVYGRDGRCIESWGDYPDRRDPSLIDALPAKLADGDTRVKGIHHCRFDYMPGHYSEVANSTQVRRYFGNERGTLEKQVENGAVVSATYREDGHLMARMDAMQAITTLERDARGRILKVTDGLGRTTLVERDGNGRSVRVTDPAGGVTRIERDNRGNILSLTDAVGATTTCRRDERGLITERISPTGARRTFAYDPHGNLASMNEPNGGAWRLVHDALGRLLSRTDPLGAETRYTYSQRGDLVGVRDALGAVTRYGYDGEGHLIQVVDPKGRITAFEWGGYHKLCARKDAGGNEVRLRYNLEGELCEVHNEHGEVHRLRYDISGRLIGETTFDGRELRYRHDAGRRVVRTENGRREITDLTYDLVGQLLKRALPDGSVEEFAFNARGELVESKSPAGELRFERDAVGRIVRETQIVGGKEHWIEVAHDLAGERVGRKTSLGHTEVVIRGALGERARTVLDGGHVVDHQADLLGREIARALPQGGWIQSSFDALGQLSRRRAGGVETRRAVTAVEPAWLGAQADGATVDTAYRYDWDGELAESADRGRGSTRYEYDPLGQLLAMVPEKARSEVFRYDAAGNIHESGAEAEGREYGQGNRLLRKGNTAYRWDDDGRLIERRERAAESGKDEVWRYAWDAAGLMRAAEGPDGTRVEFVYDPFARRMQKRVTRSGATRLDRVPVSVTRFVWDGDVLVHEIKANERTGGDPIVERRTYLFKDGSFEPVAHCEQRREDVGSESGGWFHYLNDPIGTPERLVGSDGEVACELTRKAWGETEAAPGAKAITSLRFQGQYEDEETGLTYNRWRYYDAAAVSFTSADPLGLAAGLRMFGYATNPVSWIDPFGLDLWAATRLMKPEKGGGILKGRRLTEEEAISRMGNSKDYDVYADTEKEAMDLANASNKARGQACTPLPHSAHDADGKKPKALPHIHPDGHDNPYGPSPHIFFPGPKGSPRQPIG